MVATVHRRRSLAAVRNNKGCLYGENPSSDADL